HTTLNAQARQWSPGAWNAEEVDEPQNLEPETHGLDDRPDHRHHGAGRGPGDELLDPREEDRTQDRAPPRDRRPAVPARDVGAPGPGHPARQPRHRLPERRRDLPGDAGRD